MNYTGTQEPILLTGQDEGREFYDYYRTVRGFDPAVKGDWQHRYADMLDHAFGLRGKRVLDIGCAMGALTLAMQERGAEVWGIDITRYFIQQTPFEAIRGRLLLGDATQVLPLFRDCTFDLIHASQVLEHIPAEKQAALFGELRRVLVLKGVLFAALPMGERSEHDPDDDATHVCIKPKSWWEQFRLWDFTDATAEMHQRLVSDPMFQQYHWDHLLWWRCGTVTPINRI